LRLYLDSSALVKRYVKEDGSEAVLAAMNGATDWSVCRIGFVETVGAVCRGGEAVGLERFKSEWINFEIVEVDRTLTESAAQLSVSHGLRALDALHLAAALALSKDELIFATWDARLHRAAREQGLRTLPVELG
jgi:predicted nucleic acid-binding protein